MPEPRRTFAPVVLLGLASAALAAVAGTKPWTEVQPPGGDCSLGYARGFQFESLARDAPLAGALGLVVLAAWGVLLVTRGRFRRLMAGIATLAAVGYLATAVASYWTLKDGVERQVIEQFGRPGNGCPAASVWMDNGWWPVALLVGVLAVLAGLAAVRLVPAWPEMGSRYDAPATRTGPAETQASAEPRDLWRALDEGQDPTSDPSGHDVP